MRAEDGSNAAGEAVDVSLLWECTMRRRMKWRYVSIPCCSDSCTRAKHGKEQEVSGASGYARGERTHRAYLDLIALEILLCEGGEEEDNLRFDDGVDVGACGTVHGWGTNPV